MSLLKKVTDQMAGMRSNLQHYSSSHFHADERSKLWRAHRIHRLSHMDKIGQLWSSFWDIPLLRDHSPSITLSKSERGRSIKKLDVPVLVHSCCIPILKDRNAFYRGRQESIHSHPSASVMRDHAQGPACPTPAVTWTLQSVTKQLEWAKIQPSSMYETHWCRKISFFFVICMIVIFPNPAISKLFNFHIMLIIVITLLYVMSRGKNEWEICSAWNYKTEVQSRHMSLCLH